MGDVGPLRVALILLLDDKFANDTTNNGRLESQIVESSFDRAEAVTRERY